MSTLRFEQWGNPSNPRVILVHGSLNSAAGAFSEQQPLADRWNLIAPYRRGYAPSPPTDRIDPDRDADDIIELIGDGAHLVGTSMGGVVAMRAAAKVPKRIWSLTVIEPPALPNAAGEVAVDNLRFALRTFWQEHSSDSLENFVAGFLQVLNVDLALPSPLPPPLLEAATNLKTERPWNTSVPLDALVATTFPKLMVSGGGTPAFEVVCDVLARRLDGKRVLFPGSPHAVQRIGSAFNDELAQLLTSADRALAT